MFGKLHSAFKFCQLTLKIPICLRIPQAKQSSSKFREILAENGFDTMRGKFRGNSRESEKILREKRNSSCCCLFRILNFGNEK